MSIPINGKSERVSERERERERERGGGGGGGEDECPGIYASNCSLVNCHPLTTRTSSFSF